MGRSDGLASPEKAGEHGRQANLSRPNYRLSPLPFLYPLVANYLKLGKQDGQGVAVLQGGRAEFWYTF